MSDKTMTTTIRGVTFTVVYEDGVWWATSDELPGSTIVGRDFTELRRLCDEHLEFRHQTPSNSPGGSW